MPGKLPIYVRPGSGGSYTIDRPGQLSTTFRLSSGSSTVTAAQVANYLYPIYQGTNTTKRGMQK